MVGMELVGVLEVGHGLGRLSGGTQKPSKPQVRFIIRWITLKILAQRGLSLGWVGGRTCAVQRSHIVSERLRCA
jgi:hypothetical protein